MKTRMKTALLVSLAAGCLLLLATSPASASDSVELLEHCRSNANVVDTFTGTGCHQVSNNGASFAIIGSGVQALFFETSDCSGPTSRAAESSNNIDFCANQFENGNPMNDKVRSVQLVAACPVSKSFSQGDYCFEGGRGKANCCICPPGTKWSNVSANYRQCIPK